MKKAYVACIIVLMALTAQAEKAPKIFDGEHLLKGVNAIVASQDKSREVVGEELDLAFSTLDYLAGYRDALDILTVASFSTESRIELRKLNTGRIGIFQMARIVQKYLLANPERLHSVQQVLIYEALKAASIP